MFDMMNMLGKVKEVQAKMQKAKADLVNITLTSEAGAGMVKVTVNGHRKVLKLEIDPELIKTEDKQTVEDLTVAAINKAMDDVEIKIKEELKKSTDGVLPNIPGLDLGNMF